MSDAEPPPHPRCRPHRFRRVIVLLLVLACGVLIGERWLGRKALDGCKRDMEARGEVFHPGHLWLPNSARSTSFSAQLIERTRQVPEGFGKYAGRLAGIVVAGPGEARRGSQEVEPPVSEKAVGASYTWQDLDGLVDEGKLVLRSLREMMQNPPAAIDYDWSKVLLNESFPNFSGLRVGAQTLHTAAMVDLHRGDLAHATQNLQALSAFPRLHEEDPTLVSFMIRIVVFGLNIDAYWDALQASGWTEAQLTALQEANQWDGMLSRMPRIMEGERIARLNQMEWFRSHSYSDWINKYGEIYRNWGMRPDGWDTHRVISFWRQCAYSDANRTANPI